MLFFIYKSFTIYVLMLQICMFMSECMYRYLHAIISARFKEDLVQDFKKHAVGQNYFESGVRLELDTQKVLISSKYK